MYLKMSSKNLQPFCFGFNVSTRLLRWMYLWMFYQFTTNISSWCHGSHNASTTFRTKAYLQIFCSDSGLFCLKLEKTQTKGSPSGLITYMFPHLIIGSPYSSVRTFFKRSLSSHEAHCISVYKLSTKNNSTLWTCSVTITADKIDIH